MCLCLKYVFMHQQLELHLAQICRQDSLVRLIGGDFNARVGVLKPGEEEWQDIVGKIVLMRGMKLKPLVLCHQPGSCQ